MTLIDLTAPVVRDSRLDGLPVAVIGAGPIGLAAAAHLAERGLDVVVIEAGDDIAASVRAWGHVRLFETRVRRNIRLAEAPSHGRSIFGYDPARPYPAGIGSSWMPARDVSCRKVTRGCKPTAAHLVSRAGWARSVRPGSASSTTSTRRFARRSRS